MADIWQDENSNWKLDLTRIERRLEVLSRAMMLIAGQLVVANAPQLIAANRHDETFGQLQELIEQVKAFDDD